jgi:glyoxylate/hydroxypyruvate reductase A
MTTSAHAAGGPVTVVIASPLEERLAERIATAEPERTRVVYEPDLLPIPRYSGDHDGMPPNLSQADVERWRRFLRAADVLFDFDWHEPAALPKSAPRVHWVQATVSGVGDYLVRTGLRDWPVTVTTAAGIHGVPLSEFVALGLLYFVKQVPDLRRWQEARRWERYTAASLAGKRVLLIGLGRIGSQVARYLSIFGVDITGMARSPRAEMPEGITRLITRDELLPALRETDALVLACPYTPETHHLIGAAELGALPRHAIIVNIARGAVIDEPRLVEALAAGRLAGACLDVVEDEPLDPASPLWDMDRVLLSPHSASTVEAENDLIVDLFIDNLRRYLDGQPLRNVFDRERGY